MIEQATWLDCLNRKMPVYRGCTFEELIGLGVFFFVVLTPIAMFVLKLMINMAVPGIIVGLLLSIILTQLATKFIERFKDGKPDGYLLQSLRLWCARFGIGSSIYITRCGKWSVGRTKS